MSGHPSRQLSDIWSTLVLSTRDGRKSEFGPFAADKFGLYCIDHAIEQKQFLKMQITQLTILGLHDVFNYEMPFRDPSGLAIMYGDNGAGKTTVLTLLFHLLSAKPKNGHLTAVGNVPFNIIQVSLSDGTVISAKRENSSTSYPVIFSIEREFGLSAEYRFAPPQIKDRLMQEAIANEMSRARMLPGFEPAPKRTYSRTSQSASYRHLSEIVLPNSDETSHDRYFEALRGLRLTCYFMGTDRRMYGDLLESWDIERAMREINVYEESELIAKTRTVYLKDALSRASRHLSRQIIRASNAGSRDADGIYADIVSRLVDSPIEKGDLDVNYRTRRLVEQLAALQLRSESFSSLGLVPELKVENIFASVFKSGAGNIALVERVLQPYIASVDARLKALDPLRKIIETLISSLNNYLKFKRVSYTPTQGFQITGLTGRPLQAQHLSSGEQQLLLMFCSLVASAETHSIFIIDEPEISLNVKWQRELVSSLKNITAGSEIQLVMATHSIELLTQHSEAVVSLNPQIVPDREFIDEYPKEED